MCFTSKLPSTIFSKAGQVVKPLWTVVVLSSLLLANAACKEGVTGGSIESDFSGLNTAQAISPTAVSLKWTKNDKYSEYKVYGNYQSEPLVSRVFEDAIVEDLAPASNFTFKVVALTSGGSAAGGEREVAATTWPRFVGPVAISKDIDGNIVLEWNYDYPVKEFQVFMKAQEDPTAANTSDWSVPSLVTTEHSHIFKGLVGSTKYHFVVHAVYREGEVERPTTVLTATTASSFPTPNYTLSKIAVGDLPFAHINPVVNALYLSSNYTTQFYMGGDPVSDSLVGQGTLVFSNSIDFQPGPLDNIELRFNYSDGTIDETLVVDGLSTYIKTQSPILDVPPVSSSAPGQAFEGRALAAGDFNCDGYEDLAVGAPEASIRSLGVRTAKAGAVYIYYSKRLPDDTYVLNRSPEPRIDPVNEGVDPQLITFDDLSFQAGFGSALASGGNLNGDKLGLNECEDLIVGAPGQDGGVAFVFFGNRKGLKAPAHVADFPENTETCDGLVEDATCSAVKVWDNYSLWPQTVTNNDAYKGHKAHTLGKSAAFIGDFNADGYEDFAVGAPGAEWHGTLENNTGGGSVGLVVLFFGSRFGLGQASPTSSAAETFRHINVYPPVPQAGMQFGASIAGGVDVDGGYRLKRADGKFYGGSDFVVGAPGFEYFNPSSTALKAGYEQDPDRANWVIPKNGGWTNSYGSASNHYGVNQNLQYTEAGIAFLFYGIAGITNNDLADAGQLEDFWACGSRGILFTADEHFSCLVDYDNFRVLFPRNGTSRGFGSAVAMLGDSSYWDENNTGHPAMPSDPNGDGFGEVVVAASRGNSGAIAGTGVLWQYYGNAFKLYEFDDFYNLNGDLLPTSDWRDNDPSCTSFAVNDVPTKKLCAPTLIRSNSIPAGANLGSSHHGIQAKDITGDGRVDLVVGAPRDSTKGSQAGAVYAFTSTLGYGLTSNFKKIYNSSGDPDDLFGSAVAVGNFDGDSNAGVPYFDIVVGAPGDEVERPGGGAAYGYNSGGLALAAVKAVADFVLVDKLASQQGYQYELTRIVGDINGDGYDDAISKMMRFDQTGSVTFDAVVFYGSKIGLITSSFCIENTDRIFIAGVDSGGDCYPKVSHSLGISKNDVALPQLILKPNNLTNNWAEYGFDAGDVNADGYSDVLFVSESDNGLVSTIVAYFGTRGGLQAIVSPSWLPAGNDPQIVTTSAVNFHSDTFDRDYPGTIPIRVGDFNGDGHSDMVVVQPHSGAHAKDFMNTATNPLLPHPDHQAAAVVAGYSAVAAGDGWLCYPPPESGTGCNQGAVSPGYGAVNIIYGSSLGFQTPSVNGTHAVGTDFDFDDTSSIATIYGTESATIKPCNGGDPNICKALYISNPVFENINYGNWRLDHKFGTGVSIMDVNGDGYDDLQVSAPGFEDISCWDDDNAPRDYGRVYIYYGSANGLLAAERDKYYTKYAGLGLQGCPLLDSNSPGLFDAALATPTGGGGLVRAIMPFLDDYGASPSRSRRFGARLAPAGDLNNDGHEDLMVLAPEENLPGLNGAGSGYIYYGPLCGADNDSSGTAIIQSASNLNVQLSYAGPPLLGNVTAGSDCAGAGGVTKPPMQKFRVMDAVGGLNYGNGHSWGRKGELDLNGDGYDDFLLGSGKWDDLVGSRLNVGRGVVFFGGQNGLSTNGFPGTSVVNDGNGNFLPFDMQIKFQGDEFLFFERGLSSGDINGDGTVDFMVPSYTHDGAGHALGVDMGAFMLFY